MNTILEMREKRANLWEAAKNFADTHKDDSGLMTAEDAATYENMVNDVDRMAKEIERMERRDAIDNQMRAATSKPYAGIPMKAP